MGGYAARIASHKNPFVVGSFVAQYFLIVVVSGLSSYKRGRSKGERALALRGRSHRRPEHGLVWSATGNELTLLGPGTLHCCHIPLLVNGSQRFRVRRAAPGDQTQTRPRLWVRAQNT